MASLLPEGQKRSRSGIARHTGVSRQQLTQWFDGRGEPRFSALGEAAEQLGVRRVDLVAAYDGVTAPETEEAAPPQWAERLLAGTLALEQKAGLSDAERDRAASLAAAWLASAELSGRHRRGGGGAGGASGA